MIVGHDSTGMLEAIDVATGGVRWSWRSPNWIHSDPLVFGDTIIATWGDSGPGTQCDGAKCGGMVGKGPGGVAALDVRTGGVLWKVDLQGSVMTAAVKVSGRIVVATGAGLLFTLDPASGRTLNRLRLPGWVSMANPVAVGDDVFVAYSCYGCASGVSLVRTGDMRVLWASPLARIADLGTGDVSPTIESSMLLTSGTTTIDRGDLLNLDTWSIGPSALLAALRGKSQPTQDRQYLIALSTGDGGVQWSRLYGAGPTIGGNRSGRPAVAAGVVVMASPTTGLVTGTSRAGRPQWQSPPIPGLSKGELLALGNVVAYSTVQGTVAFLDARSGARIAELRAPGRLKFFLPHRHGDELYVPLDDGRIWRMGRVVR
jgi:outer membrane protein assembly factor BamB